LSFNDDGRRMVKFSVEDCDFDWIPVYVN